MSQTSFLEDVVGWDEETCSTHLDEALPKLISILQDANDIEEEVGILKIISHSFLPCIDLHGLEEKLLSKITEKTCLSFDRVINILNSHAETKCSAEDISSNLGMAVELVDCIETCMRNLVERKQQIELTKVRSLPGCAVHLLSGSYSHCQDSSSLYKDLLGMLSEPLSVFFRKAHSLQMAFLNLLDQITVCGEATEQDLHDLCKVCDGLYAVCQIVTTLDVKAVISLWKALSKVSSQHKEILCGHLDVCRMICYLCGELTTGYKYLFTLMPSAAISEPTTMQTSGDEKAFVKSLKILGFQMKILVTLVKDFKNYLGQCEKELLSLLILIYRYLPPSLTAPTLSTKYVDQIRSQITVAIDPLLKNLLGNRGFRQQVTAVDLETPEDHHLPLLLIQIQVLEMLPRQPDEEQDAWLKPTVYPEDELHCGILQAVFTTLGKCFVELALPISLPGVPIPGTQQREVSLYEFVCTSLCGFIGSFPARHFIVLEETLLTNVLSRNPFLSALATDCWCFVARYGSAELCDQHVHLLISVYQDIVQADHHAHIATGRVATALRRLVKFMAPQHQQELVKQYPPKEHLALWCEIPLDSSCMRDVVDDLVTSCTKNIHNLLSSSDKRQCQLTQLVLSIKCLGNIFSKSSIVTSPHQQSVLTDKLSSLWRLISSSKTNKHLLYLLLAYMYKLSASLIGVFNTQDILLVISTTQKLLSRPIPILLQLEIVLFLQKCGSLRLNPSFEQSQVLQKLPDVFTEVLKDRHPVVHHIALQSFTQFAEETVHESVVQDCIARDDTLQEQVVAFLNKIPKTTPPSAEYLRHQLRILNTRSLSSKHTSNPPDSSCTPTNKRPRIESEEDNNMESKYTVASEDLKKACSLVENLLSSNPPSWFLSSVKHTVNKLSHTLPQN